MRATIRRPPRGLEVRAAWRLSWAEIVWPIEVEAATWRSALAATKAEWRACYESRPPTVLAAQVVTLGEMREWSEHAPVERIVVLG